MLKQLWQGSRPLTAVGLLMLVSLVGTSIGLAIDPRMVTDAPVWLKPAKFAASIAIYTLTLAWIFIFIPEWARTRRVVGWGTAVALILEVIIIGGQAFRGRTSHFNVGTPLDAVLFGVMGATIVLQTISTIWVAVALWRTRFADAALGWALRLGVAITIVGAFSGGLMTQPTNAQLDAARAGERMTVAGAHTVGAPDGGPGLAGTGWSTRAGDLRVPHFLGLHAMQALPLISLILKRRRMSDAVRVRLTVTAAASYFSLFGILLSEALRGYSVVAPDALTLTLLGAWLTATLLALANQTHHSTATGRPAVA